MLAGEQLRVRLTIDFRVEKRVAVPAPLSYVTNNENGALGPERRVQIVRLCKPYPYDPSAPFLSAQKPSMRGSVAPRGTGSTWRDRRPQTDGESPDAGEVAREGP